MFLTLLLCIQFPPLLLAEGLDVPLSRRHILVAEELLDSNDVSCPDVHLCGPRGPEVVRLHLLIEHSVYLLEHCMDKCILMSIVHEQLCAVVKLFTYLYFKLAANLLHLVP